MSSRLSAPVVIQWRGSEAIKRTGLDHTAALFRKEQSRLFFMNRFRSFSVRQSVGASTPLLVVVASRLEVSGLNKVFRKTSYIIRLELDSMEAVVERRTRDKIKPILENPATVTATRRGSSPGPLAQVGKRSFGRSLAPTVEQQWRTLTSLSTLFVPSVVTSSQGVPNVSCFTRTGWTWGPSYLRMRTSSYLSEGGCLWQIWGNSLIGRNLHPS